MYTLSINMWFQKLLRQFFFNLDKVVYGFISVIYDLLISIARTSVLSQSDIIAMADKIYKLLAVFMVFKVTFSLIMYIVNPDDFSDKSKGVTKLGLNIVISLALLILVPYIFNTAFTLQRIVLEDNSLAELIMGNDTDEEKTSILINAGDRIAYYSIKPFFTPNLSITEISSCIVIDDNCYSNMEKLVKTNSSFTKSQLKNYEIGIDNENFDLMFRQDLSVATTSIGSEETFVMDYKFLFSTVVGVIIVIILITFCMDVALRSIKLAFLQLIAPIPIISFVDPKSGKDGLFKKWYQMCFKTYLSLFIRLIALYFAIYIIGRVGNLTDIVDGSTQTNALIVIFIIIGALMFAKQLPKILEGLGLKLDGGFTLNPIKKFENQALGGKRITGAAGGIAATLPDRIARVATTPGGWNKFRSILGAGPGLLGGAIRGASANGGFNAGRERQAEFNRRLRDGRINGLSATRSYLDYVASQFGMDDATLEKEATLTKRNRDAIDLARRQVGERTRESEQEVKKLNQQNATRKNTRAKLDNVKTQGKRLKDFTEDFTNKKADIGVDDSDRNLVNYLRSHIGQVNGAATGIDGIGQGDIIDEEMIARAEQHANRRMYSTNIRADEANIKFLTDNQGKTLDRTFMIGNQVFKKGEVIDGSTVSRAQDAQENYLKKARSEVFEELAKGDNSAYKKKEGTETDVAAFGNTASEYDRAVTAANVAIDEFNSQYTTGANPEKALSKLTQGHDSYKTVKAMTAETDTGNTSVQINDVLAKIDEEVERYNREIEDIKQNAEVEYYDERGKRETIKVEDADSRNKPREETVKWKKEKSDQRRQYRRNIRVFGPGGGKK